MKFDTVLVFVRPFLNFLSSFSTSKTYTFFTPVQWAPVYTTTNVLFAIMNNKSRPEQPVTLNISNKRRRSITKISVTKPNKKKSKSPSKKKRSSSKSKQNKYVPGEYIYDTKGQMAEIKYIGQVTFFTSNINVHSYSTTISEQKPAAINM